jgi:hypothetical protein
LAEAGLDRAFLQPHRQSRPVLEGGTVLFSGEARVKNSERNAASVFRLYGPHAERIDDLVEAANAGLHTPDGRD